MKTTGSFSRFPFRGSLKSPRLRPKPSLSRLNGAASENRSVTLDPKRFAVLDCGIAVNFQIRVFTFSRTITDSVPLHPFRFAILDYGIAGILLTNYAKILLFALTFTRAPRSDRVQRHAGARRDCRGIHGRREAR